MDISSKTRRSPVRKVPHVIGNSCGSGPGHSQCVSPGSGLSGSGSKNFHDVTIFDMGEVPESSVSIPELSALSQQWPPAVISHMGWRQKELCFARYLNCGHLVIMWLCVSSYVVHHLHFWSLYWDL